MAGAANVNFKINSNGNACKFMHKYLSGPSKPHTFTSGETNLKELI